MSKHERLRNLIAPKTLEQASIKVAAIAYILPEHIKVFEFAQPVSRKLPGMELHTKLKRSSQPLTTPEENFLRSLRETLKRLRAIALCNSFELFATFTFKQDRQDIIKCKNKMSTWLKNQQKRGSPDLDYLIVPEFHKDGVSLHFHALIKNFKNKVIEAVNPKTGRLVWQNGRHVYTIPSYRSGFTNVKKIDDSPTSHAKMGGYLSKYITKDMPVFPGKKRFWVSDGLKRPPKIDISPDIYQGIEPTWSHINEWGRTLIFPKSSLPNIGLMD